MPGCMSYKLVQISQEAGQVVCYPHLFQNFSQFIVIHTVKGFGIVNKAEIEKHLFLFLLIDYAKAFDCVRHNKLWKILK